MDVVLHVSDHREAAGAEALANLSNLLADETVDTDQVALVANAGAIQHLQTNAKFAGRVRSLLERDVSFFACGNAMRAQSVAEEDLVGGVTVATSGVGAVAQLEADGYHYIKVP